MENYFHYQPYSNSERTKELEHFFLSFSLTFKKIIE